MTMDDGRCPLHPSPFTLHPAPFGYCAGTFGGYYAGTMFVSEDKTMRNNSFFPEGHRDGARKEAGQLVDDDGRWTMDGVPFGDFRRV